MSLIGFEDLACPKCSGLLFRQLTKLQWQEGRGTVIKPAGHECVVCNAGAIDMATLITNARKRVLERRISDLQAGGTSE